MEVACLVARSSAGARDAGAWVGGDGEFFVGEGEFTSGGEVEALRSIDMVEIRGVDPSDWAGRD